MVLPRVGVVADRRGRARREIVERSLEALRRLAHPGAIDAHRCPSHSAGILTAIPWDLLASELPAPLRDPTAHRIAAMLALDPEQADRAILAARSALRRLGWHLMSWREVPMRLTALAPDHGAAVPRVVQCFARAPRYRQRRTPYRTRLAIEARWRRLGLTGCSVTSLSDSTIVYKGLVDPAALPRLFPDLADPRFISAFAVIHHGGDANTWGRWDLAQPFHGIACDGEITTIGGNRLWMDVRISDAGIRDEADLLKSGESDSQTLDAAIQWLRETGLSTPHALARLLPPAWEHDDRLPPEVRAFHRHEACFAEPWDGPAAIAYADGRHVGAAVDRNGFCSFRAIETDELVCVASEPEAFDVPDANITKHGQLAPGEMLVVDLDAGTILQGDAVSRAFAAQHDYVALASRLIHRVPDKATNPPFDTIGVAPLISLRTLVGRRGQWTSHALPPVLLELDSPILLDQELEAVLRQRDVRAAVLPIGFDSTGDGQSSSGEALRNAVTMLQNTAAALAANGTRILVLSDRRLSPGLVPIPARIAAAAVDSGLRSARLRLRASIVVETRAIRDAYQAAVLARVGASAVVPYLLYATAAETGDDEAAERCRRALEAGLRSIMSEAGVSSFEGLLNHREIGEIREDLLVSL